MIYIFHYNVNIYKLYLSTHTYLIKRERDQIYIRECMIYHKKCFSSNAKNTEYSCCESKLFLAPDTQSWSHIVTINLDRRFSMEYRIPPSREYPLWQVFQDIPTCPKFRIVSPSTPPFSLEFLWGALPELLSQSSSKHNSLLFQSTYNIDKALLLWSAIVICVRSHSSPHWSPPPTINKSGFNGFRKWLSLSIQNHLKAVSLENTKYNIMKI